MSEARSVLFVCTGNSCRSVMAEGLLRKYLKELGKDDIEVRSAGPSAVNGSPATKETIEVMKKEGIDVSPFMYQIAEALRHVGVALLPIVPAAAERMLAQLSIAPQDVRLPADKAWGRLPAGAAVAKGPILFPRLPA